MGIHYDRRNFRLRIRDDGKGIDPKVLAEGRAGHFGLAGIQERAKLAGGKLAIWSQPGAGTEIELTIPASLGLPVFLKQNQRRCDLNIRGVGWRHRLGVGGRPVCAIHNGVGLYYRIGGR